jgi:hypothetical protein
VGARGDRYNQRANSLQIKCHGPLPATRIEAVERELLAEPRHVFLIARQSGPMSRRCRLPKLRKGDIANQSLEPQGAEGAS